MLIAAATRAPDDRSHAAKLVWDNYYANHQLAGSFQHLNVADIFMGGGTTLIEGSRLGMKTSGNDLNPVAWFVVKQELADVDPRKVAQLLSDVEANVKPQIIPFYFCDGPNGEKGTWTKKASGKVMGPEFDPFALTHEQRKEYNYSGPELVYTFWARHAPCQVIGCGHRTPLLTTPVMAVKAMAVKSWERKCSACATMFDIEDVEARMAPDAPIYIAPGDFPHSVLRPDGRVTCPHCGLVSLLKLGKSKNKKVELTLLVHPDWLVGRPKDDDAGRSYGGSPQDDTEPTARWNTARALQSHLLEVRGKLPELVTCPKTNRVFSTGKPGGNVPKRSTFDCASCGTSQDVMTSIRASKKAGQISAYAIQGVAPGRALTSVRYAGRFFATFDQVKARQYNAAIAEWDSRKYADLADFWPRSEVPYGFMTAVANSDIRVNYGFTHWWTMFNPRQLLVNAVLLKTISTVGDYDPSVREYVLAAYQQYLRNQNLFALWNIQADQLEPMFSNNNYHPKATSVENNVFAPYGRGNWNACASSLLETLKWRSDPWETVAKDNLSNSFPAIAERIAGRSAKAYPKDSVGNARIACTSSTSLDQVPALTFDMVITDPPFGGLLHYSELADFFHVWLRLVLKEKYPDIFGPELSPKALEAVANKAREPDNPDGFYQRLLTACWKEAHRILKPGGILAFTFHHSEDAPWVAVLESLFDAGFYLEATYPIRSDETKGEGEFGSKTIEYDIIHVCRKRTEEPKPVSWGRMRREVLADVRQLQSMLENHARAGLPAADLQVIRRGKALEYFSRHYGNVYVDEGRAISVKDALVGINQLIDEDAYRTGAPPPVTAEPITRQFLRIFDGKTELARDQMQKLLRGSGIAPDEFTNRGWAYEQKKVFYLVDPLLFAREWQGRHKRRLSVDLDQALVLIGACYDGSGINAADMFRNENFRPHAALKGLLEWIGLRAPQPMRNAALRALSIYKTWAATNKDAVAQMTLFEEELA